MLSLPILLISTKLHRPAPRPDRVMRPELLLRLHRGSDRKLTLISAPAGFGKTTLTSQWLASSTLPAAWLSLDQHDNQPAQFLRYLVAAVRTCMADACPTTYALVTASPLPDVEYLSDTLVSELSALPSRLVLVLDDYHHIRAQEVHDIVRHLLRYLPPSLHLVILTRFDPPLPLGRLRIDHQMTELRASDLRFVAEETRQFLDRRLCQPMSDDMADALHVRTDGWITGLELASISLQQQPRQDFLAHFRGSDRLLVGYLVEEVMAHLPEDVQTFLIRTALVDRFCAPLADALAADMVSPISSRAAIVQLEEMNLFIIPLDNEGYWYRFHDLFRDFLRFQLKRRQTSEDLTRLHRRAIASVPRASLTPAGSIC